MRNIVGLLTAILLAGLIAVNASGRLMISYWITANHFSSGLVEKNVKSPPGQCKERFVNDENFSGMICSYSTRWGSISADGRIRLGDKGGYYKVVLPSNNTVIVAAGSDKLYIKETTLQGYNIKYYDNAQQVLKFNQVTKSFVINGSPKYLLNHASGARLIFTAHNFSNNGYYLVGITDNKITVVDLADGFTTRFGVDSLADEDAVFTPAISDNGNYIVLAGANFWKLEVYDIMYCSSGTDHTSLWRDIPGLCETKVVLSDNILGGSYPSNPLFSDDGRWIFYNIVPSGGGVDERVVGPSGPDMSAGGLGFDYIALGDSYSSGEGDAESYYVGTDGTVDYPSEKCHLSINAYSTRLSSQFSGEYFSVACSGAVLQDIAADEHLTTDRYYGQFGQIRERNNDVDFKNSWYTNTLVERTPGRIQQAEFIVEYRPRVVTLGVGGNNIGFRELLEACAPGGKSCSQMVDNRWETARKIEGLYGNLVETYQAVINRSYDTKLFVVGYPLLFKDGANSCGFNVLLDGKERRFTNETVRYLNQVIKAAAYSVGAYYVDIEDAFGDNVMCGKTLLNIDFGRAINGIVMGDDIAPVGSLKIIGQESYHPTAYGHQLIADKISRQYGSLLTFVDSNCQDVSSTRSCQKSASSIPAMPSFFASSLSPSDPDFVSDKKFSDSIQNTGQTQHLSLTDIILQPLSTFGLSIRSEAHKLGEYTVDVDGLAAGSYSLPSDLPSGYHTLVIDGLTPDGKTSRYTQTIFVYNPDLPPVQNSACGIIPESGLDQDNDGIDDACDGQINAQDQMMVYSRYDNTDYSVGVESNNDTEIITPTKLAEPNSGRVDNHEGANQSGGSANNYDKNDNQQQVAQNTRVTDSSEVNYKAETDDTKNNKNQYLVAVAVSSVLVAICAIVTIVWRRHRTSVRR